MCLLPLQHWPWFGQEEVYQEMKGEVEERSQCEYLLVTSRSPGGQTDTTFGYIKGRM